MRTYFLFHLEKHSELVNSDFNKPSTKIMLNCARHDLGICPYEQDN